MESMKRLVGGWQRWVLGTWWGSRADRVEELSEVSDLDTIVWTKRARWVTSVYGRALPILRKEAEKILREYLEPKVELSQMRGGRARAEVVVVVRV